MKKAPLVVIGFRGNGLDGLATLQTAHEVVAFLDDSPGLHGTMFEDIPILPMSALSTFPDVDMICLIGSEKSYSRRQEIIARIGLPTERYATIIDPAARVSRHCRIGRGTVVFPGVVVTYNAVIGNHVLVLPQTVIHHDAQIGNFTLIGSSVVIAGSVTVGESCYIGSGSTIKNDVRIGTGSLVGMAANVLKDVEMRTTVAGNPARVLRSAE